MLGFDLDDPTLTPGTITYADFVTKIRDPIRSHLSSQGLEEQIIVLVLTKGIPHRIADINAPNVGETSRMSLPNAATTSSRR